MKKISIIAIILFCSINHLFANVRIARLFNENMVLQRNKEVPVWGEAAKGEKVTVIFNGQKLLTSTDQTGRWMVKLKPMNEGGPYEMIVKGKNLISLKNILIGEVWFCSGQSNMAFMVSQANNSVGEIANANFPQIRYFNVAQRINAKPLSTMEKGEWQLCNPATVGSFSAVAYFFARNLYQNINVPIGIIQASWGGTNAESWMSADALLAHADFKDQIVEMQKTDINAKLGEWNLGLETKDLGRKEKWEEPETDLTKWKEMNLPIYWEKAGLPGFDGVVWFRKEIELTKEEAAGAITLNLGPIDNSDETFVNSNKVGSTDDDYAKNRVYKVDAKYLKEGKNTIVVRVTDLGGGGGIWGKPENFFYLTDATKKTLVGAWQYRIGTETLSPKAPGPNTYPTLLFNGMLNALIPYAIQGVAWYQGENNASRAYQYRTLFPELIADWRKHWNQGDFPFLFVQLANYQPAKEQPGESTWAELREAQTMTLSNTPATGMALAIDLGEANDIHPKNKQDVGFRLSLSARKVAYHQDLVYSGPTYDSMKIENGKITVSFKNTGSGLITKDKYNYVKGFAIAGKNKKFYWAKAVIDGNTVTVYSDQVPNPVAVRYAWDDNPDDANLYNKEDLPAVPFRTDSWDGITKSKK
jgi:sialate O-acetylesterase